MDRHDLSVCTRNDRERLSQNWSQDVREAFAVVFFTAWSLSAEHLAVGCYIDRFGCLGVRLEVLWSLVVSQERRKRMAHSIRSRQPGGYSRTLLSAFKEMLAVQVKPVDGWKSACWGILTPDRRGTSNSLSVCTNPLDHEKLEEQGQHVCRDQVYQDEICGK
jgi:hypothetical protein